MFLASSNPKLIASIKHILFAYALIFIVPAATVANGEVEHKFGCPNDGYMSGINYRYTTTVDQIEFVCTSSMGNETFGPYGGKGNGKLSSLNCPTHHYISSFYGSKTTKINRLGLRCRHQNDLYGEGQLVGEVGEKVGTNFDGLASSLGRRPVAMIVETGNNSNIVALRVDYADFKKEACRYDWTDRHGRFYPNEKIDEFKCPDDGVVFGVTLTTSSEYISSIQFICKSSEGITYGGPYGNHGASDKNRTTMCSRFQHFSYFYGEYTEHLSIFSGFCVASGNSVYYTKKEGPPEHMTKDNQTKFKQNTRDNNVAFNDECYAGSMPVRRPVQFRIFSKEYVHGIRIEYKSIPVEWKCAFSRVEVIDDIVPNNETYEILGTTAGSTCSQSLQQLCLGVSHTRTNSNTTLKLTSNDLTNDLAIGIHVDTEIGPVFSSGIDASGDLNIGVKGQFEWDSGKSFEQSNATAKSEKVAINYQGPGAAVVVGYIATYKFEKDKVDVKYHSRCEGGSTLPIDSVITIRGKLYGNVHFQDYQYPFNNTQCTTKLRVCISRIRLDGNVIKPKLLQKKLKVEVDRCLKGKINR